jgi:hypothetical protein
MSDMTDYEPTDHGPPRDEAIGARDGRARRRNALLAVLLLLLLLFACAIFWPVPGRGGVTDDEHEHVQPRRSVSIVAAQTSEAGEVPVTRKGYGLAVDLTLENKGPARTFDPNWLSLEIAGTRVPPLAATHEGVPGLSRVPDALEQNSSARMTVIFAAPRGATEATLVVSPGDVPPAEAGTYPLVLSGGTP